MSSRSFAKKARAQQQQFFFNRPALPCVQSRAETQPSKSRGIKPPSPHSPLARYAPVNESDVQAATDSDAPSTKESNAGDLIQSLQHQIRKLETSTRGAEVNTVSTGCDALDQLLPENGLVRGTIIEWLADGPGNTAATLALIAARNACYETGSEPTALAAGISGTKFVEEKGSDPESRNGPQGASHFRGLTPFLQENQNPTGTLIVVDPQQLFYPPAAAAWGIDLKNTIVLRPKNAADQNWALQQSLACPAVAAVWTVIDEIDERSFRRFQLAAEQSGCLGLFQRGAHVRHQPSWSEIQLAVRPLSSGEATVGYRGRRLQVQLLKCRGGATGRRIELEINEATGAIRGAKGPKISKPVVRSRQPRKVVNRA